MQSLTASYKLVINLMTSDELYDLKQDPQEMDNLINDHAYDEIKFHLHDVLIKHMDDTRDPFRGYYWEDCLMASGEDLQDLG